MVEGRREPYGRLRRCGLGRRAGHEHGHGHRHVVRPTAKAVFALPNRFYGVGRGGAPERTPQARAKPAAKPGFAVPAPCAGESLGESGSFRRGRTASQARSRRCAGQPTIATAIRSQSRHRVHADHIVPSYATRNETPVQLCPLKRDSGRCNCPRRARRRPRVDTHRGKRGVCPLRQCTYACRRATFVSILGA